MQHPKDVGDTSFAIMHALRREGYVILVPFGENTRYDLAIDDGPELGTVYLVPIADVAAKRQGQLRVDPPRNNQRRKVRLAAAYEVARFDVY